MNAELSLPTSPRSNWRAFYVTWAGQFASAIGGPFQTIAVSLWALQAGYGPRGLGTVLAVGTVAQLVGVVVGGPVIDRLSPLAAITFADSARFVTSSVLGILILQHEPLVAVLPVTGCAAMVSGIFLPALRSIGPVFLQPDDLHRGNSLFEISKNASLLGGALIGGLVVGLVGPVVATWINAVSFLCGAVTAAVARRRLPPWRPDPDKTTSPRTSTLASGLAGLRFALGCRWLLMLLALDAVMDLTTAGQLGVGLPVLAHGWGGGTALGILLASFGAGSALGAALAPRFAPTKFGPARTVILLHLVQAPLMASIPDVGLDGAATALLVAGILNGLAVVYYASLLQSHIPHEMLGRVMALLVFAGLSMQPVAQLATSAAIAGGFLSESFAVAAAVMAGAALLALRSRTLARL